MSTCMFCMLMLSVKHKRTHMQCHAVGMVDVPMGDDKRHATTVHTFIHAYVCSTNTYVHTLQHCTNNF